MSARQDCSDALAFLTDGGMGALMRAHDWSGSPLGAPEAWPQSLRSVVGLMLGSKFPMFAAWGDDLGLVYNDAYAEILGAKHPQALGRRFHDVWAEIWPDILPLIDAALAGEATYRENLPLLVNRRGAQERAWFTFSYSPVRDEAGRVAGMFCACTETTAQVLAEERRAAETERQRRMFAQAPGFICTLRGPDHVFDFVNATHERLFGSRGWVGRAVREAFPELAGQGFYELLDRVYATGERHVAQGAPVRYRPTPDAPEEERFLDFIYEPMRDEAGRVTGIFCEGHDVTARTLAEQALRTTGAKERFLVALGDALRPMSDPREIVAATTRALGERLGASRVVYSDIDAAEGVATTEGDWTDGTVAPLPNRLAVADFGAGLIAALATGETLVVHDVRSQPATVGSLPALDSIGVGALISVPLVKNGRFAANLNVHGREPRTWTPVEVEMVEAVAARTWDVLARARAVRALTEREHELQILTDSLPVLISYVDADRRYRFINRLYEEWFPRRRDEVLGKPIAEVIGPKAYDVLAPYMDRVLAGERLKIQQLVPYADAGTRHIEVEYVPRRGGGDRVEGFYALVQDISERKTAEAALRASEERLRELNETLEHQVAERTEERDRIWRLSPDLMCVARIDGTLLAVNPAWERLLGWPADWLVGRDAAEIKHPDDADRTAVELARLAAGRSTQSFEDRYRHKDGSWRWIAWTLEPEGQRIYCVGRDVTAEKARQAELRAAEAARREADALYRAYFENTAEALFVVGVLPDGGFTVQDLNPAHQASIGLRLADVAGRRIDEILPPELAEPVTAHYRRVLASGEVYQYREDFKLSGGTSHWDTVLVPVRDAGGRIVRLIGSSRDLTRQMAAEEQLRQSQKMEAMGQLTGGVAHDFNNLLTPIIGSLDRLLTRGTGSERERRMIDGALQSAERAKTLIQRLLAFARRQPLQAGAVDLGVLVTGMADLLGSTLGPKIDVQVDLAPDLPPAHADANQVEMALLNLAVNARDAMPEGGRLTVAASRESVRSRHRSGLPAGHYVRLAVADTGTGMDAGTLARAVEPFFSTKGIGKGTGLGLSMVHGLAAQLGGALTIQSHPGQGTIVELWLPVSAAPADGADVAKAARPPAASQGRALLVDDEDLVRMSTADMLEDLGFDVIETGSAEDALRLLRDGAAIDLLVTDHLMPGLSGADLARAVRADRPGLPILIVSGYAEADGIAPDLPRLVKPFRAAELAERLAALAERPASTV